MKISNEMIKLACRAGWNTENTESNLPMLRILILRVRAPLLLRYHIPPARAHTDRHTHTHTHTHTLTSTGRRGKGLDATAAPLAAAK